MEETPNLALPYIMAAQAQKHVTHNEAIRALDALVQLTVLDRDLSAPPGAVADGARFIVAAGPTGAWAGQAGNIAAWQDGAWQFYVPSHGWLAWVTDEDALLSFDGTDWVSVVGGGESVPLLGINATADTTNRLAVASDATLFTHDGADHRMKINKAAAGDTASQLFQTNFSGRAEFGLTGDDDFHVKVSPDGSSWFEALVVDRASGEISFPNTTLAGGREVLTANRTYYVRTDGSDSNDGLTDSAGGAFATIQKAIDTVASLDLAIFDVTIQVRNGTYTGANTLKTLVGAGLVTILGDAATPANVVVSTTSATAFRADNCAGRWRLQGLKITTTTSGRAIHAIGNVVNLSFLNLDFGAAAFAHIEIEEGAKVLIVGPYAITGGALLHWEVGVGLGGGRIGPQSPQTITLTGTPAFSQAFVRARNGAGVRGNGLTFSGSATGKRYEATLNAVIDTGGGGANFFPGNVAGTTATGGQYA